MAMITCDGATGKRGVHADTSNLSSKGDLETKRRGYPENLWTFACEIPVFDEYRAGVRTSTPDAKDQFWFGIAIARLRDHTAHKPEENVKASKSFHARLIGWSTDCCFRPLVERVDFRYVDNKSK